MNRLAINYYLFFILLFSSSLLTAQEITPTDYQRAESLLWENLNNKKIFNLRLTANFYPDSSGMWYADYGPEQKDFYQIDFDAFQKVPLFNQERLADSLQLLLEDTIRANALPFNWITYLNEDSLEFNIKGKDYVLDRNTYQVAIKKATEKEENSMESLSPDGKWIAYSEDYNLFVKSVESGEVHQLSTDGKKNYEYATYYGWGDLIEGENGTRPEHFSVSWSPDSKYLRTNICDLRQADKMYLLDYSVDTLYRPRLLSYYRGSPGDTTILYMTPVFYNMATKQAIKTSLERRGQVHTYGLWWIENSNDVLIMDLKRGYQQLDFSKLDLNNGQQELLFSETSETNLGENLGVRLFEQFDKFIFLSERSGWQQLYAFDFKTKTVQALTPGEFIVHSTVYTDQENGWIYFLASGKNEGDNPYYQYLYRVSIEGGNIENLTPETGNHNIRFSPDGKYFIDDYSTYDQPGVFKLRAADDGRILTDLLKTDIELLSELNWSPPQAFEATARDGKTIIHGAIWKPSNFDPNKKYPVLDYSYTGPHTQVFPRRFEQIFYGGLHDFAELGFIVLRIDGMGTYGRSKAFHDVSYKNMGQNLLDHVLAIRQLSEQYTWVDTTRVGIFGHSAGGFDAGHAVLAFPDFYKVAVASSADHDFRMEKAWWPEMYMGWPVDSSYQLVSNITMAGNLQGKLLITHGSLDENVNPSATFKLAEALIKADKEFDMLILPSQHHGYRGKYFEYFRKKRWNYFLQHLRGVQPIWNYKAED